MQSQEQTHHQSFFIDGGWTAPASSKRIEVIGPMTAR